MNNDTMIQQGQTPKKNFLIPILVVLVLVAVVEFFLLLQKDGKLPSAVSTVENEVVESTVQEGVAEGAFSISTVGNLPMSVGTPITFVVKADSNERGVVGMDALVSYDKNAFTAGQVQSSLPGFTVISSSKKEYLEMTMFKDQLASATPVLRNTDVFSFTLTPTKAGVHKVELLSNADKSSTKFVNSETAIFLPKVNSVTVTVK